MKIWDLKQQFYEGDPIILYDHEDEVVSADIRHDGMLASMDIQGTIYVRNIADPETVLFMINSVPKEPEDLGRLLFNSERQGDERELLVVINDQIINVDFTGRHIDSVSTSVSTDVCQIMDNKFLYRLLIANIP